LYAENAAPAAASAPVPLALADPNYVGYENFTAPGVLVPVKTTEAGQQPNSVEYMGRNAGEPSVAAIRQPAWARTNRGFPDAIYHV
jgi:hypothetical protein